MDGLDRDSSCLYFSHKSQGAVYHRRGEYRKALEKYDSASRLRPRAPSSLLRRSKCHLDLGETDKALEVVDQINKKNNQLDDWSNSKSTSEKETIEALYQRAEVLFQNGEFEEALVLFHKCHKSRPHIEMFKQGVIKTEHAIASIFSVGEAKAESDKRFKTKLKAMLHKDKTGTKKSLKKGKHKTKSIENLATGAPTGNAEHQRPSQENKGKKNVERDKTKASIKTKNKKSQGKGKTGKHKTVSRKWEHIDTFDLQIETDKEPDYLAKDRRCLQELIKNIDPDYMHGETIHRKAKEALSYVDTRTIYWAQQLPRHIVDMQRRKLKAKVEHIEKSATGGNRALDDYKKIVKAMMAINRGFSRGLYNATIEDCRTLIANVAKVEGTDYQDVIMANCFSLMGNSYLELGDVKKAITFHAKDLEIATEKDLEDAKSRALDNMGRAYARIGEFKKAIAVWTEKLPLVESPQELAWLCHEIGYCYLETHQYEEAKQCGVQTLDSANEIADVHWQLNASILIAQSMLRLGEVKHSKEAFESALVYAREKKDHYAEKKILLAMEELEKIPTDDLDNTKTSSKPPSRHSITKPARDNSTLDAMRAATRSQLMSAGHDVGDEVVVEFARVSIVRDENKGKANNEENESSGYYENDSEAEIQKSVILEDDEGDSLLSDETNDDASADQMDEMKGPSTTNKDNDQTSTNSQGDDAKSGNNKPDVESIDLPLSPDTAYSESEVDEDLENLVSPKAV